jgi:TRAP-type mannitol/chloroaromatic compound transport system permease large subunit
MAALIAQNLAPIMFAALVALLLLGYPVAFTLGAVGLAFFVIGVELAPYSSGTINLSWPLLQSLPDRVLGIMANETLLAIPFFTFMGLMLERSGMAEDLLETVGQLFGTARGGLAYAVIFVGALLAATTGVVAASVIAMGLISLPIMLRYGYDRRLASGVIAASGTLAQIIPPSLVLIVLADQLGRSVGAMYAGAFLPGLLLALLYAGYVFIVSRLAPKAAPGLPAEAIGFREESGSRGLGSLALLAAASALASWWLMRGSSYAGADRVILSLAAAIAVAFVVAATDWLIELASGRRLLSRLARQATFVMVPPLLLIFLVLGTIFIGLATPTEGGAMGALGALLLAFARRLVDGNPKRFNLALVRSAAEATARLSAFVLFILIGARIFSLTFYGINGHLWVERLFTALPGGETGFLVVVNVLVFVLAFFLDFFELAFIVVPLIAPVADRLGIDLVWFGVMLAVNMQTSFMHPPFGFALFFLRSVAPREAFLDKVTGRRTEPVTTGQIYWGAVPFLVIQLAMVALVILFPGLVLHEEPARPAPALAPIGREAPTPPAPIGGLSLPGTPPAIPGAPAPDLNAPPAPVLDLSVPPPSLSERAPPDSR